MTNRPICRVCSWERIQLNSPTIDNGSTTTVTNKSDIAKFAMNIPFTTEKSKWKNSTKSTTTLSNVPMTDAMISTRIQGMAMAGDSVRNPYFPKINSLVFILGDFYQLKMMNIDVSSRYTFTDNCGKEWGKYLKIDESILLKKPGYFEFQMKLYNILKVER